MRLSRYFLPILSQAPPEAELASHALMLRAGLVREEAPGIFAWLPLGLRVLDKVCAIVRTELDRTGALEMLMPTIQPIELWERSGRSAVFGEEMLQLRDRHARRMLYGPSAEEIATDLMQASAPAASDLPRTLYQISWKFRDQRTPHSGTLHAREFLMKDAYAFDLDPIAASHAYNRMFVAYLRIFDTIGLEAIPVLAEPGQFGGEFSHEFVVPVASGETTIHCDRAARDCSVPPPTIDFDDDVGLQGVVDAWTSHYAAVGGMHEPAAFQEVAPESRETIRGIEVGHIFYLGTTYSAPMQASVAGPDGEEIPIYMGSFGLGLSRLVAAIVEVHHDDFGIVWPSRVAPFDVALINLRVGHAATDGTCTAILAELEAAGFSVLYDDRDARPDAKIALADLIGLPWQVIVGPQVADTGRIELRRRANGERDRLPPIDLLARLRYA